MEITLNPGSMISGIYEVVQYLGSGADGDVQLVKDVRDGTLHSLKLVTREHLNREPAIWDHYMLETEVGRQVASKNIIRTELFSEDPDRKILYLVKEYVEGQSLQEYLNAKGALPFDQALTITRECAKALSALTAAGIVHRDLKPENILFGKDSIPRLNDFGIALVPDCKDPGVTEDGKSVMIGTPGFSAPEQWQNAHTVDAMADVYSLGVILYLMVSGELPFPESEDPGETIRWTQTETAKPVSEVNDKVPAILEDLIASMIALKPSKRPQGPEDLIRWIDTVIWELPKAAVRVRTDKSAADEPALPQEEEGEEISDEELFGADVREKQKRQKIVIAVISVFALFVIFFILDAQFHITRKFRGSRKRQPAAVQTVTVPAAPSPAPVPVAEEKKTPPSPLALAPRTKPAAAKELPPEQWDDRAAADVEKRMKAWKVLQFASSGTAGDALAALTKKTGLKFVTESVDLNVPCRVSLKDVSLYDAVRSVLAVQPDSGFRAGAGKVSVYSITVQKQKDARRLQDAKIRAALQQCPKDLAATDAQLIKAQKTAKSLNGALKAKRSGADALKKAESLKKRAASLSASVEKIRAAVKKTDDLLFELPAVPALDGVRKNLTGQKELLAALVAESDRLKTAAEDAFSKETEAVRSAEEKAARDAALKAELEKKEQRYQADLKRRKEQEDAARKAGWDDLARRQEEARRKAAELSPEQRRRLITDNYAKARDAAEKAAAELQRLSFESQEARKNHRKLASDNVRHPIAKTREQLAIAQKDLETAQAKRKAAETQYEEAVKKAQKFRTSVGAGNQEIRAVQRARESARNAQIKAAGMENMARARLAEAQRLYSISEKVEKAGLYADALEKKTESARLAKIKADEAFLEAETAYFEMVYQVKGRDFAVMNSAVPVWKGKTDEEVSRLLKELFVMRIRFCNADVEKAFRILEKASGLTIVLSEDLKQVPPLKKGETPLRRSITCDVQNTNMMDFLTQICEKPQLSPASQKTKIVCGIAGDGKISLSLRVEE